MTTKLVGISPALSQIEQEIDCAARSDAKVLVTGESGVGKDIVARLIHERSRRHGAFVTINCAGIPDSLLESELFGHVRGSFTDASRDKRGWLDQAKDGTVFMDEVGEMSLRMQALLLRFLENGEIQRLGSDRVQMASNARVIVATNRNLLERIAEHTFREDLYYRLNVIHICIPPLRARPEDVAPLVTHFLDRYSETHGVAHFVVSEPAMAALTAYGWPGNVRELRNIVERVVIRSRGAIISPKELPLEVTSASAVRTQATGDEAPRQTVADTLYERVVGNGEPFWSAVYDPFMARDITRADLRAIVARGLEETRGSYTGLIELFNLSAHDYKRFLSFLKKHECRLAFQRFRVVPARLSSARVRATMASHGPLVEKVH